MSTTAISSTHQMQEYAPDAFYPCHCITVDMPPGSMYWLFMSISHLARTPQVFGYFDVLVTPQKPIYFFIIMPTTVWWLRPHDLNLIHLVTTLTCDLRIDVIFFHTKHTIKHIKHDNMWPCVNWIVRPQGDTNNNPETISKTNRFNT